MASKVYFLPWNKRNEFAEWLKTTGAYKDIKAREFVALKIHFGEEGNTGFISPDYVKPIVKRIREITGFPFLTDAGTIYVGRRADAYHHLLIADKHGFNIQNCGCPVIIADGLRGNAEVEVQVDLKHFKKLHIANAIHYSDFCLFLSHFKGHEISGFGGALKNMGMGCGTRAGKYAMHHSINPSADIDKCTGCGTCVKWCSAGALSVKNKKVSFNASKCIGCGECILSCAFNVFSIPWNETVKSVQEKIVEYAYGVLKDKKHFCVNFLNHVTQYCDCYPDRGKVLLDEIGIVAGSDPVAVDQASADIVNQKFGKDFWRSIFPEIDWTVQLDYAEKLGLGTRKYSLQEY